jgi:predicted DNA binding protein
MITATEILKLLTKAKKLGISTGFVQNDIGYKINFYYDWRGNNDYYYKNVFIKNDNSSDWEVGDYTFDDLMDYFNKEIEEQLAREDKAKKRKEFLESLTPEQRELLDM